MDAMQWLIIDHPVGMVYQQLVKLQVETSRTCGNNQVVFDKKHSSLTNKWGLGSNQPHILGSQNSVSAHCHVE